MLFPGKLHFSISQPSSLANSSLCTIVVLRPHGLFSVSSLACSLVSSLFSSCLAGHIDSFTGVPSDTLNTIQSNLCAPTRQVCSPPCSVVDLPRVTPLQKHTLIFSEGIICPELLRKGWDLMPTFRPPCLTFVCAELVQTFSMFLNLCEFLHTASFLYTENSGFG